MRALLYSAPAALVAMLLAVPSARADHPLAGNWKVIMGLASNEAIVAIVSVEEKDGKPTVTKIAGLPRVFETATVDDVQFEKNTLRFKIKGSQAGELDVVAYLPKDDKPKALLGSTPWRGARSLILMERTDDKTIDGATAQGPSPASPELRALAASGYKDADAKIAALLEKYGKRPIAPIIAGHLIQARIKAGADEAALKKAAETMLKVAKEFGPEMEPTYTLSVAQTLSGADKGGKLAVEYARAAQKLLGDKAPKAIMLQAQNVLLAALIKASAAEAELKAAADEAIKIAKDTTPALELATTIEAARTLMQSEKAAAMAVEYARAALKLIGDKGEKDASTLRVNKVLANALAKTGKADESKEILAKVAKIEGELDEEFEKKNIPFEPEKFAGRKDKTDRIAVVELFTGAQCPPCVAADTAFDAMSKSYNPTDVIFLQYHLHIPGPDALTNADAEARARYYYGAQQFTPNAWVSGKEARGIGGAKAGSKGVYEKLGKAAEEALNTEANVKLQLTADRKGDEIEAKAVVTGLKEPGDKMRLRFVLTEDVVRYPGRNGQRLHHHVVRGLPGGVEGIILKGADQKETIKISISDVAKTLDNYLTEFGKTRGAFDDKPLDLKNLKLVAMIQNDETKQILQAVQIDVPTVK